MLEAAANAGARAINTDALPEWQFGRLLIGTEDAPIDCHRTVKIKMTAHDASSREGWGAMSDSVPVGNKTIASMGGLSMVGCGSATNYMRIKNTAAAGSNSITVDAVPADWTVGMKVAVSPSGPVELEYEMMEIASTTATTITFTSAFQFDHEGYEDTAIAGLVYSNAAEVGILTRNIKIDGSLDGDEDKYGGRVIVLSAPNKKIYRQGHATISNVEFSGMAQYGMTDLSDPRFALAFYGIADAKNGKAAEVNIHEASGNEYQPAGYDIGPSYVKHSSFYNLFGVAIGASKANMIEISNNVVFNCIDDGIKVGESTDVVIDGNMVTGVWDNVFYNGLWKTQHNFDFDGIFMPYGIHTIEETTVASMKNDAVSGVQGGAYTIWGETCDSSEADSGSSVSTISSGNIGHSSAYGLRPLFTQVSKECVRYSGFSFSNLMNCGFCSIVTSKAIIVENFNVYDAPLGVFFNNFGLQAVSHNAEDNVLVVKDSNFVGVTAEAESRNCNRDYIYNSAAAPENSMMEMWGSAHLDKQFPMKDQSSNVAFAWSNLQGGMHSYPHKPCDKPTKNMVLYERNYIKNVHFENYGSQCGAEHFAISNLPKQHDHHVQTDIDTVTFTNVADSNKLFLFEPQLEWINPSECVDMDCDGPKKAMVLDVDGSFSQTGQQHTYMGVSELDYGINGPRGLGNWRIPAVMIVNLDGSNKDPDVWAPNKGVFGTNNCAHDADNHYYKCNNVANNVEYAQVLYESMDIDTETRRVAPIAYMTEGTVDIVNGVLDTSCCGGYACQLRQTTHPMIMACGKSYELATTGTLNKDVRLHMNRQPTDCAINLKV